MFIFLVHEGLSTACAIASAFKPDVSLWIEYTLPVIYNKHATKIIPVDPAGGYCYQNPIKTCKSEVIRRTAQ